MEKTTRPLMAHAMLSQATKDFMVGFNHVRENHLSLRARQLIPSHALRIAFMAVGYLFTGNSGAPYLNQMIRLTLFVGNSFRLIDQAANHALLRPHILLWNYLAGMSSKRSNSTTDDTQSECELIVEILSETFRTIVLGPIMEETVYRWFPCEIKKWLFVERRLKNDAGDSSFRGDQGTLWLKPLVFGYSPWSLATSALFGLGHVNNVTGRLEELIVHDPYAASYQNASLQDVRNQALSLMGGAIYQCTHSTLNALRVYNPLYEKHGIMASFGAHAAWNFYAVFDQILIPLEIGRYALDCLRKRTLENMGVQGNGVEADESVAGSTADSLA